MSYTTDNEKTYVICNDSEEATTVTVSKSDYSYTGIAATLSVSEEEASLDGEKLTIPAFGCVILNNKDCLKTVFKVRLCSHCKDFVNRVFHI